MGIVNLIFRLLRLGPLALGVIAAAILIGAYFLQIEMNKGVVARAVALEAGPPAIVEISEFDREVHSSAIGEVTVEAQLLWEYSYDLWYEKEYSTDYVVMFPLVAANSSDPDSVVGVAILEADGPEFSSFTPEQAEELTRGDGKHGPIMALNGEVKSMGQWRGLIEDSFWDLGLDLPEDVLVVWPYVEGREAALAPPEAGSLTVFGVLSKVACAFALLGLAKLAFPKTPVDPQMQQEAAFAQQHAPSVEIYEAPSASGMDFYDPVVSDAPKRRFGVRKVLIGVVGALFVLGAVSTISDMMGGDASVVAVSDVTVVAEPVTAAESVTSTAVSRDSFDLAGSLTTAADWIDETVQKAASGDKMAMAYVFAIALVGFLISIGLKRIFGGFGKIRGISDEIFEDISLS